MSKTQHRQLAESLLAQIADGTLAVGDRLPTEVQLCASTGLARGTVRRALEQLEDLGMISRRRRAGTVVTSPVPVSHYEPVARSAADIAALSVETKLHKPKIGEIVLDRALAQRIGARSGSKWFAIIGARVYRNGDGEPLCWSEHYVRGDVSRTTILRGVLTEEDVASIRTEQTIYADLLDDKIARALDAKTGSAAFVISRKAWDDKGRLISVGIHTHRGDRYRISTEL
jgi:DNA-binding GntR family transcriptional regulator